MSTTANVASTNHHAAHATGGADAITPASIGALAVGALTAGFAFNGTSQTANFVAVAATGYHIDTTSGAVQATLPDDPADGDQCFFEIHAFTTGNNFTVIAGSGDTLERSITRSLGVGESVLVQFDHSSRVWYEVADSTGVSLLDARYFAAASAGTMARVSPSGTADAEHYLTGAATYVPLPWTVETSIGTATVDTSGLSEPTPYAMATWALDMSCVGLPSGSALTVQVRYTTDGGSTFTDVGSALSLTTTTTATATATTSVPSGARLEFDCTSAGSGTAATKVHVTATGTP